VSTVDSTISLLDVSVLLATWWAKHEFHERVGRRLAVIRTEGWATCPITEAGFVRVSAQPSTKLASSMEQALLVLKANLAESDHVFWPNDASVAELLPEIRQRLVGPKQITDAILLDLAIRKKGRLVTLDQRVRNLLPADSEHQSAIEVIPAA
jgi:toxin-antitoxin system PIN domain toxin